MNTSHAHRSTLLASPSWACAFARPHHLYRGWELYPPSWALRPVGVLAGPAVTILVWDFEIYKTYALDFLSVFWVVRCSLLRLVSIYKLFARWKRSQQIYLFYLKPNTYD